MEDIADAANGYTGEEIYGRVYGHAAKYDNSSRPKISHMEDIADAANRYTREEINGRIYGCATKYNDSSRPKISHMTKGNDGKVTASKDNQTPRLLRGDEVQDAEDNTNLRTNKTT